MKTAAGSRGGLLAFEHANLHTYRSLSVCLLYELVNKGAIEYNIAESMCNRMFGFMKKSRNTKVLTRQIKSTQFYFKSTKKHEKNNSCGLSF